MRLTHLIMLTTLASTLACWSGCTSSRVIENTRVPEIVIDDAGAITFNNERLQPGKIARAIKSAGIERTQEINIRVSDNPDRALMKAVTADLIKGGYTRTIFVKERKTSSTVTTAPRP